MKSTWFADRRRYEFARLIRDADPYESSWKTMDAFLQASFYAMRQGANMATGNTMDQTIEDNVIAAQQSVKHPKKLAEAFGALAMGLDDGEGGYDMLGTTIMEMGQNDVKWRGQCFTPPAVCELMAEVTIKDQLADHEPSVTEPLLLNEPACGGGAMVIAASKVLRRHNYHPRHYRWLCVDVDWRMFAICYVQLTLLNIPANVVHGNTLSLEEWDSAQTLAAVMSPILKYSRSLPHKTTEDATVAPPVNNSSDKWPPKSAATNSQLALFRS